MGHKDKIHRIFDKKHIIQQQDYQSICHKNHHKTNLSYFFDIHVLLCNECPMLFIPDTWFLFINPMQQTIVCFQDLLWENFILNKLFSIIRFHQKQRPIVLDILLLI
jgi:hypothetical protein